MKQLVPKTGIGRATIYLFIKEGKFPQGKKISERIRVWKESEIDEYMEKK